VPINLLTVFIAWPWLAAVPAIFFFWLNSRFHLRVTLFTSLLWTVYLFWELGIWAHLFSDGDSNIRIDLLLIYPLLAVLSALSIGWVLVSMYRG
jgi:hypothetical protein